MIFDALSNAAYRVSLSGPGAEIEGEVLNNNNNNNNNNKNNNNNPAVVENLEAQQGAG